MPENKRTQLIMQLRGFDARHYANTERYARQIDRVYKTACDEYARLGASLDAPEGEAVFSFDKYPLARKQAQGIMQRLAKKVESVITSGTQSEWLAATYKNDAFISSILRTSKLTKEEAEQYQGRNLEALNTFQRRKIEGLGLSEHVWKQAEDMKAAIELGIDVAIGDGRDAQQLSRDLRSYLQEPKRLYRRVRDKGGVLRLSKAAKMYHPGQGVYRSSAKNAQRLARTEINMAYRESEFLRWQKLDFVVGIRVCLSNNHTVMNSKGEPVPLVDICDELWGDYPKTFKFVGWHPQCRCYVVPILSDYDEYNQDRANRLKAIVRGMAYKSLPSRRSVVDVPRKFREYIDSILERSKGWKSQPYYIRDNFVGGKIEGGLNPVIPTKTMNAVQPCTEFDTRISMLKRWAYALGLDLSNVDSLRTAGNRAALLAELERLDEIGTKRKDAWIEAYNELSNFAKTQANGNKEITDICDRELRGNAVTTSHYYGNCINRLKQAVKDALAKLAKAKKDGVKTELKEVISQIESANVAYKEVKDLPKTLTEAEIIQRVGGGDLTEGSCSSLTFAYAGNKCGFDVLDFRDGQSRFVFSRRATIESIAGKVGGIIQRQYNDFASAKGLLQGVADGKEYIFCVGKHAAIIRKTKAGFEYLELQSHNNNGFKPLTTDELKRRFKCQNSHIFMGKKYKVSSSLIDIERLKQDGGFKKLLGFINTKEDEQKKGKAGRMK